MDSRPIGVFDSGVGGLTVLKRLIQVLPEEDYIYFGDTKRVPYGDRSKEEIELFAGQIINFMKEKNVKAVVIACNTTCATIDKGKYDIELFDVLKAGAESGVYCTKNKKVGVIATKRTVESRSYEINIKSINPQIEVYQKACPEFVPLIEKGLYNSPLAYKAAKDCLEEFKGKEIDTLILGCTHYPLMEPIIKAIMGDGVRVVDPAVRLSHEVKEYLERNRILNFGKKGKIEFFVSGDAENFKKTAGMVLGKKIDEVFIVDIERY
ncbi:glutamate racemase [Caldanaerobacter subterraneus KAk]|uniref:glutamate racemase n=1 Tax=Caldanaerobacter subterraneus TaxID=911092 RepID=UPI0032BF3E8B